MKRNVTDKLTAWTCPTQMHFLGTKMSVSVCEWACSRCVGQHYTSASVDFFGSHHMQLVRRHIAWGWGCKEGEITEEQRQQVGLFAFCLCAIFTFINKFPGCLWKRETTTRSVSLTVFCLVFTVLLSGVSHAGALFIHRRIQHTRDCLRTNPPPTPPIPLMFPPLSVPQKACH